MTTELDYIIVKVSPRRFALARCYRISDIMSVTYWDVVPGAESLAQDRAIELCSKKNNELAAKRAARHKKAG